MARPGSTTINFPPTPGSQTPGVVASMEAAKTEQQAQAQPQMTQDELLDALVASGKIDELVNNRFLERERAIAQAQQASVPEVPKLPEALAIFRCDLYPFLTVPELDMSKFPKRVLTGKKIQFRLGSFRALTQNQVDHLRWAISAATHDGNQNVIGGMPFIYEDDGEERAMQCPHCKIAGTTFVTTSEKRYRSHMESVHGTIAGIPLSELGADTPVQL